MIPCLTIRGGHSSSRGPRRSRIDRAKLFPVGDTKMLMYRYDTGGRGDAWVPHDQVQKSGQDWHYAFWNPETNEIREVADPNDTF
jgi:hypothetical protein